METPIINNFPVWFKPNKIVQHNLLWQYIVACHPWQDSVFDVWKFVLTGQSLIKASLTWEWNIHQHHLHLLLWMLSLQSPLWLQSFFGKFWSSYQSISEEDFKPTQKTTLISFILFTMGDSKNCLLNIC